jgi:hypothetical protein
MMKLLNTYDDRNEAEEAEEADWRQAFGQRTRRHRGHLQPVRHSQLGKFPSARNVQTERAEKPT